MQITWSQNKVYNPNILAQNVLQFNSKPKSFYQNIFFLLTALCSKCNSSLDSGYLQPFIVLVFGCLSFHYTINLHFRNSYYCISFLNSLGPVLLLFYVKNFTLHLIVQVLQLKLSHYYRILLLIIVNLLKNVYRLLIQDNQPQINTGADQEPSICLSICAQHP